MSVGTPVSTPRSAAALSKRMSGALDQVEAIPPPYPAVEEELI
jgi:hypothetical protein